MSTHFHKIAIVTPLRDEADNIERLFNSVESQSIPIHTWIIVENGSTDGSVEQLESRSRISKIDNLTVLNAMFDNNNYALGSKYSQVVAYGFEQIKSSKYYDELTHIGILDADCFPEPEYYQKLINHLIEHPKTGITSGIIYDDSGKLDAASIDWVRGGCRLWSIECFKKSGYIIGPSADALSSAKASANGWDSTVCQSARIISRQVGARTNYKYYGQASHYRGIGPIYATIRALFLLSRSPKMAAQYLSGYYSSLIAREPRVEDHDIITYYKSYPIKKIKSLFLRIVR